MATVPLGPDLGRSGQMTAGTSAPERRLATDAESRATRHRRGRAAHRYAPPALRLYGFQRRVAPRGTQSTTRHAVPVPQRDPARGLDGVLLSPGRPVERGRHTAKRVLKAGAPAAPRPHRSLEGLEFTGHDWVIAGGESGTAARALGVKHARALRDRLPPRRRAGLQQHGCWATREMRIRRRTRARPHSMIRLPSPAEYQLTISPSLREQPQWARNARQQSPRTAVTPPKLTLALQQGG